MQLKLSFDCKDTSWSPSSTWVKCYFRRYLMRINPFDKNGNVICFCQTVYGPDAPQQFQYLGYKYNLAFDDVLQIPALKKLMTTNPILARYLRFSLAILFGQFVAILIPF